MTAFDSFYSFYRRTPLKGIHGTAIFTKRDTVVPVKAEEGIGSCLLPSGMTVPDRIGGYPLSSEVDMDYNTMKDLDQEGRTTVVDCGLFVLINLSVVDRLRRQNDPIRAHIAAQLVPAGTARTRPTRNGSSSRITSMPWSIGVCAT